MKKIKKIKRSIVCLAAALVFLLSSLAAAAQSGYKRDICAVYITGIGCPACAKVEPLLFSQLLLEFPELVIIEYEVYQARQANREITTKYFDSFICEDARPGIPFLILNGNCYIGPFRIEEAAQEIRQKTHSFCALPSGEQIPLSELIPSELAGQPRIWTKNRVFILESSDFSALEGRTRDRCLVNLIRAANLEDVLEKIEHQRVEPEPVNTSGGERTFAKAAILGNWRMQWEEASLPEEKMVSKALSKEAALPPPKSKIAKLFSLNWVTAGLGFILGALFTLIAVKRKKALAFAKKKKDLILVFTAIALLSGFFAVAVTISPSFLRGLGYQLPLPLFTFIIALVDGFNPCNMFVLTVLLTVLISASASRKRFYFVGFIFVLVVFLFYLLFMAAWLNIFKYIGFAGPLRLVVAGIALAVGLINCKEFFFFKKGPSLMIADKQKGILYNKMRNLTVVISKGSLPLLLSSSVTLAIFSSLIEIPCTAGFPILYASVLSAQVKVGEMGYFLYLIYYNLIYVLPLLIIIVILGFTFQAQRISEKQAQIIKFIGGIIMILLGIILLVNPQLVGAAL